MNFRNLAGLVAVGAMCVGVARADVYTFNFTSGFTNGGVVPDGNLTGWWDTRSIFVPEDTIVDVNVFLTLSGGYNGDLYGYLVHDTGFAVLFNRMGRTNGVPFGYSDSGLNVTFDDDAANGDIHYYQQVSGYAVSLNDGSSWAPDGRAVNPATIVGDESRTALLSSFIGLGASGSWTLFLADLSVGETTTVVSWGLEISAVPEPSTGALVGLGLLCMAALGRFRRRNG